MKLSTFKEKLSGLDLLGFQLPDGNMVPGHFHVTEVGQIDKRFIDCGGTLRDEKRISFQLWEANDYDHRLHPEKLVHIIQLSEEKLNLEDEEIEVEYQGTTIGKYGVDFDSNSGHFLLTSKKTDCLAKDNCGIPYSAINKVKQKLSLAQLDKKEAAGCCSPGASSCCN